MKKGHLLLLSLLVIPFSVLAANPKIEKLEAEAKDNTISYSGTTEEGSHAVMCKLYNSESEEVEKFSTAVDNKKFEGSFENVEAGEYTVYCANYEGGEIKNVKVTVEEKEKETEEPKEELYKADLDNIKLEFTDEAGHEFTVAIIDIFSLSKEELEKITTEEEYNKTMEELNKNFKDEGKILGIYVIEVEDEDGNAKTEGKFKIKIKITDEMKKYSSFKLINLNEEDNTKGDKVDLKIDGDYLVGELPHLSVYVLVGEEKEEPKTETKNPGTADTIKTSFIVLTISAIGLIGTRKYLKEN